MSFVPEWSSYCIHMTKSTGSAVFKTTVLSSILKTIRVRHSPQTTRFVFSSRNGVRFQFTWYQNEISYQNENFIRIENQNELIPEWLVWGRNFISVSCKQIQRNIWGWNELVLDWKSFWYHVNGPLGSRVIGDHWLDRMTPELANAKFSKSKNWTSTATNNVLT